MSEEFLKVADAVKKVSQKPTDQELLDLYKYFKQTTVGDVDTDRPGMLDFKGKAKWDAWKSVEGTSKAEAEEKYISLANEVIKKYNS